MRMRLRGVFFSELFGGFNDKNPRSLLTLLGCPRKSGSKVGINGLFHLLKNGIYWGYNSYNPLILTFDPNFLGHPSNPMENSNDLSRCISYEKIG